MVVQIGNSDDKLSQKEWAEYHQQVSWEIDRFAKDVHFSGCSNGNDPWQNACFVFELENKTDTHLLMNLRKIREKYNQESIALSRGKTEFI